MKKIFTSLLLICLAISASAGINGYVSIMLNHLDGNSDIIAMEEDMTIDVVDGQLKLSCDKGNIKVPLSELRHWTYSTVGGNTGEWTGLTDTFGDETTITMTNDCIEMQNLKNGSMVTLVSLEGRVLISEKVNDGSYYSLPFNGLHGGVYILTYNNGKSLKIAIK